jgi:hypothetical protein
MVFLWSSCGEMRGKGRQFTIVLRELEIGHIFQLYFSRSNRKGEPKLPSLDEPARLELDTSCKRQLTWACLSDRADAVASSTIGNVGCAIDVKLACIAVRIG